jgi:hypothetical protein
VVRSMGVHVYAVRGYGAVGVERAGFGSIGWRWRTTHSVPLGANSEARAQSAWIAEAVQATRRDVDENTLTLEKLSGLVNAARGILELRMLNTSGVDELWPVPSPSLVQTELLSQLTPPTYTRLTTHAAFCLMTTVSDDIIDVLAPGALNRPLTLSCACAGCVAAGVPARVSEDGGLNAQVR